MGGLVKKEQGVMAEINSPMSLIESAVTGGASVETLEKLMALQERYEANNAKKEFFQAMQDFQAKKPALKRDSNVNFNTNKGTTNYNFCALPDIEKALREPLSQCGLSYRFENCERMVEGAGILNGITCIVSHVSGHSERTTMYAPADGSGNKNAIQAIGSTSTYLMRYTLIAAFGLTTADEDNDGQTNSDLPYARVLQQNEALRDLETLKAVVMLKEYLADDDFYEAYRIMHAMSDETKNSLWLAPTKGGIFTTREVAKMKSNEWASARADFHAELSTLEQKA